MADVLSTMLTSGVPIVRTLEVASAVVDNAIYKNILAQTAKEVQSGSTLSSAFGK
ncbi:MAG: type II secretion system F family protein, partial [Chloroflexi bacterium]|nr:type II secretion system F family protein [Chloroflexota bacterium]